VHNNARWFRPCYMCSQQQAPRPHPQPAVAQVPCRRAGPGVAAALAWLEGQRRGGRDEALGQRRLRRAEDQARILRDKGLLERALLRLSEGLAVCSLGKGRCRATPLCS